MVVVLKRLALLLMLVLLAACGDEASTAVSSPPAADTVESATAENTAVATVAIPPTNTPPVDTPPPDLLPTATDTPLPDLSIQTDQVFLYPVPTIYEGDRVTVQLLPYVPSTVPAESVTVAISVNGQLIVSDTIRGRNLNGDAVGLYEWVWDTTGMAGNHTIEIVLDAEDSIQIGDEDVENNRVVLETAVLDSSQLSIQELDATWVTAETACCTVHVVSGTAAYRDLPQLLTSTEAAFQRASTMLNEPPSRKYDVFFVDRVIGQGGYAGSSMVVSYLDRNYASDGLEQVLIHEAVHVMDRQFAPQRITFLAEGVAVWASGGHYKAENLEQRSAALLELGEYVPLPELIDNFYPVQHEIGYLQAAGFVDYLIQRYGWKQFRDFYSNVTSDDGFTLSQAVDINLQTHFDITLAEAEAEWLDYLGTLPYDTTAIVDLQTTIRYYNTMRHYQRRYDPTAYFLTAWLPYPQELKAEGNPADLTRHPDDEVNIVLETILDAADRAMRRGDYERANILLDSVDRALTHEGAFIDPLAMSFQAVVRTALEQGYEVQQVEIDGERALVMATRPNELSLVSLSLRLNGREWVFSN